MKEELKTASEEKEVLRTKYEQIKDDLMVGVVMHTYPVNYWYLLHAEC